MQLFRKLNRRIPANAEIIAVFNFTVFLIHSWSIRSFLFRLPSMLFYFGIMDIIAVLFYMMAFALLESTLVTAVLVLISILLPGNWFKTNFLYQGFLAVLIAAIASVLLQDYLTNTFPPTEVLLVGSASFDPFVDSPFDNTALFCWLAGRSAVICGEVQHFLLYICPAWPDRYSRGSDTESGIGMDLE